MLDGNEEKRGNLQIGKLNVHINPVFHTIKPSIWAAKTFISSDLLGLFDHIHPRENFL